MMMMVMIVVVVVTVMVVMIMVMIVMVMIMEMVGVRHLIHVALYRLQKLLHAHLLLGGLGLLDDVIDHLVLEDRRPQLDQGCRILLVVLVDEALLARIAARLIDQGALELVLAHLDLLLVADLAHAEPQAYPPLGYLAVVGPQFLLGLACVGNGLAFRFERLREALPDAFELTRHQRLG